MDCSAISRTLCTCLVIPTSVPVVSSAAAADRCQRWKHVWRPAVQRHVGSDSIDNKQAVACQNSFGKL
eukprot:11193990-Lingulodinium_polyedra.AAC.1